MKAGSGHHGPPNETVYFLGWSGTSMPRSPDNPTSEADAIRHQSFYRAEYDDQGRLGKFTKVLDGRVDWADEYTYWSNGKLSQRRMTRSDGSQLLERYDKRGRLLRDS